MCCMKRRRIERKTNVELLGTYSFVPATHRERRSPRCSLSRDGFVRETMRIIDHCPSCFSSTSSDEGNSDGARKRKRKKLFMPLERYALLVFGVDKKLSDRDYYSKFYASPAVQAKSFCAGKKYEIERKHKVKKRELRSVQSCAIRRDNNTEGESQ